MNSVSQPMQQRAVVVAVAGIIFGTISQASLVDASRPKSTVSAPFALQLSKACGTRMSRPENPASLVHSLPAHPVEIARYESGSEPNRRLAKSSAEVDEQNNARAKGLWGYPTTPAAADFAPPPARRSKNSAWLIVARTVSG